jgi:hypothetical protein
MERKQLSDDTLLAVLDMTTRNIAVYIKENGRGAFVSNTEAIGAVTEALWKITKENESVEADPNKVAKAFLDVATACMMAVSSMVVTDTQPAPVEGIKDAPVAKEVAEDLALKKMLERRAEKVGIVIATEMP